METVKVNNATGKGFIEVEIGGVLNLAFPDSKTRRGRVIDGGKISPTLDTGCDIGQIMDSTKGIKIRKLTPKECFRLQGWADDYFEKAEQVNSDAQLYKQAGNGVTVNVIQAIAERLTDEQQK